MNVISSGSHSLDPEEIKDKSLRIMDTARVRIEGSTKLSSLNIQGKLRINGDLKVKNIKANGGNIRCDALRADGSIKPSKKSEIECSKRVSVLYNTIVRKGSTLLSRGNIRLEGDINVKSNSTLKSDGKIEAKKMGSIYSSNSTIEAPKSIVSAGKLWLNLPEMYRLNAKLPLESTL